MTEELPRGWVWSEFDEIASWSSGGTPKTSVSSYYGGAIPWAVIGDLTDGLVTTTDAKLTEEGLRSSSAKVVPAGTVLVAMYGASIGRAGVAGHPMATNQAIACAQLYPGFEPLYLFWYLLQ